MAEHCCVPWVLINSKILVPFKACVYYCSIERGKDLREEIECMAKGNSSCKAQFLWTR